MLVSLLLDELDQHKLLHIDVNDVRDRLVALGIQDRIRFHFVTMNHSRIRGLLYRYSTHDVPYAVPTLCSDIIIAADMGDENNAWQRLVAVKELLHITDCTKLTASSPEAVDHIFEKFSVPPELRNGTNGGDEGEEKDSMFNDRVRIFFALAVLVPTMARERLRPLWQNGTLNDREIAHMAQIPVRYVPTLMEEWFDDMIGAFLAWEQSKQPPSEVAQVAA